MRVFGPIPSRRLGRSLGINNIPAKYCSYSCVYCQVGATRNMSTELREFYSPVELVHEIKEKVKKLQEQGEGIEALTFVADGEPTLDKNLGSEIDMLKELGIKIAVITNSSLLWLDEVRNNLNKADWVSVKVDTLQEEIWRKVDVPHPDLKLENILAGIKEFAQSFKGTLVTESMLVGGVNDGEESLRQVAQFLQEIPAVSYYISAPTRPPARKWVTTPSEEAINLAYQIFSEKLDNVEYLIGYEGNVFSFTGNVEEDILSITAVHPMREDAVKEFLDKANANWEIVDKMIAEKNLKEIEYKENKFYMRCFKKR